MCEKNTEIIEHIKGYIQTFPVQVFSWHIRSTKISIAEIVAMRLQFCQISCTDHGGTTKTNNTTSFYSKPYHAISNYPATIIVISFPTVNNLSLSFHFSLCSIYHAEV